MVLHDHPVNEERSRRGLPVVNAIWPWGAGALTAMARPGELPVAFAHDAFIQGLYQLNEQIVRPLQQTVEVPANSRMSLPLSGLLEGTDAGAATTAHAGVTVRGRSPAARLYAEQATYGSTATERWARGAVARGER